MNTTKLRTQLVNQFIANCTVADLGSGSFPRLITVRTPQADGAAQVARWWGNRRLAVDDVITCRRDPNDLDVLAIDESGDAQSLLHNFEATAAPATGDDDADGYAAGSMWVDVTNDNAYICLDASVGAAVWGQINGGGGSSALTVRNNSSVTANAGVCGYLSDRDFYIGTAGNPSQRCIVTTGGANGASIEVQQQGNCTASYTGTAPSAGNPLKYDGISGVTKQSAADTDTIAYATAAGSGGTVEVLLKINPNAGDFFPQNDHVGVYGRQYHSGVVEEEFTANPVLGSWVWAGSPFGGTPAQVDVTSFPSWLYLGHSVASVRFFLYRTDGLSATDRFRMIQSTVTFPDGMYSGYRIDDGTDNNYVESSVRKTASVSTLEMITKIRTGGGSVTTAVRQYINDYPVLHFLDLSMSGTAWTSWNVSGLIGFDSPGVNIYTIGTGLTWTPSRRGIIFDTTGRTQTFQGPLIDKMVLP